tara:strand:- start:593 stop:847 length:255 start_codon:yes stop_codon:yes gene_type:complete
MIYELKNKNTNDVITKIDTDKFDINDAKFYFMGTKRLEEEDFDSLFVVSEAPVIKKNISYDWWEEERTNLDIEKDEEYKGGHLG